MKKIKVSLSQEATTSLLELMEIWGFDSPTHTANKAIDKLLKLTKPHSPNCEDTYGPAKQDLQLLQ
jgi:hypothetical protein